jgi:hypothetical protein
MLQHPLSRHSTRATTHAATSNPGRLPSTCTSASPSATASTSTAPDPASTARPRRTRHVKFVGRKIRHEWIVNEESGETEWYCGMIRDVVKGLDGDPKAVYDILYDKDTESFEVDHLYEDWTNGSVEFVDI